MLIEPTRFEKLLSNSIHRIHIDADQPLGRAPDNDVLPEFSVSPVVSGARRAIAGNCGEPVVRPLQDTARGKTDAQPRICFG